MEYQLNEMLACTAAAARQWSYYANRRAASIADADEAAQARKAYENCAELLEILETRIDHLDERGDDYAFSTMACARDAMICAVELARMCLASSLTFRKPE